jgi:hypothetical protein
MIYIFSETSKPTVKPIQPLFLEVKRRVSEGDKTLPSPLPLHAYVASGDTFLIFITLFIPVYPSG